MHTHRYQVGQTVRFVKATQSRGIAGTPSGSFKVVGLLPDLHGNNQYRVESASDGHQRVVVETEIASQ